MQITIKGKNVEIVVYFDGHLGAGPMNAGQNYSKTLQYTKISMKFTLKTSFFPFFLEITIYFKEILAFCVFLIDFNRRLGAQPQNAGQNTQHEILSKFRKTLPKLENAFL